jgi:hypothetical protein
LNRPSLQLSKSLFLQDCNVCESLSVLLPLLPRVLSFYFGAAGIDILKQSSQCFFLSDRRVSVSFLMALDIYSLKRPGKSLRSLVPTRLNLAQRT